MSAGQNFSLFVSLQAEIDHENSVLRAKFRLVKKKTGLQFE